MIMSVITCAASLVRTDTVPHESVLILQKLKKDPYVATLGGFSKVTNYIFDAFRGPELEQREMPAEEEVAADILGEIIPGLEINQLEEPGFEVITRVRVCSALQQKLKTRNYTGVFK